MPSAETFIAQRLLLSKRRVRFINVIGLISIAGITLGVAALLVALSVFNGFNGVVTGVLVGFDPHLRIEKRGNVSAAGIDSLERALSSIPDVRASSPFVTGKAMLVAGAFNRVVVLRGIDPARVAQVSGLGDKMVLGSLALADTGELPGIVIGLTLADRLSAVVGEEIAIISPFGFRAALSGAGAPETRRFRVVGIYESNNREYDAGYAYVSVASAQELFDAPNAFNGVEIRLADVQRSDAVKELLRERLPAEYTVSTWYDLHRTLYSVMRIERWSAYILLSLIIVVATFNMLGSLTMGVIEKRRDIGVLKAMGMTPRRITRLFMVEGMLIGMAGTLLGILLGLAVLFLQIRFHIFPLDPTVYIIPAIPVEIHLSDFAAIAGASLGLSFLAAYYPARRAAATLPSESLRWE
jgi:lipoprotein-releasing system permease protein